MLARFLAVAVVAAVVVGCSHARPEPSGSPEPTRAEVDVDSGVRLSYLTWGPVDGRPVVLLHGMTNDAETWREVAAGIEERDPSARVIAVDLRGHGQSTRFDRAQDVTIEAMVDDVVGFLEALDLDDATLVGHSMGSMVAREVATRSPQRLSSLVLISTSDHGAEASLLAGWLLDDVIEGTWRPALEAQGRTWPDPAVAATPLDADPDAVSWMQTFWNVYPVAPQRPTVEVATTAASLPIATWLGAATSVVGFDRRDAGGNLTVPTLVLWGTQDAFFARVGQEALIERLCATATAPVAWKQFGERPLAADGLQHDDLGHNLPWDAPAEVATDIVAFMATGEPTSTWWQIASPDELRVIAVAEPAPVRTC